MNMRSCTSLGSYGFQVNASWRCRDLWNKLWAASSPIAERCTSALRSLGRSYPRLRHSYQYLKPTASIAGQCSARWSMRPGRDPASMSGLSLPTGCSSSRAPACKSYAFESATRMTGPRELPMQRIAVLLHHNRTRAVPRFLGRGQCMGLVSRLERTELLRYHRHPELTPVSSTVHRPGPPGLRKRIFPITFGKLPASALKRAAPESRR